MNIQGMNPRYTYTNNNCGIKINQYLSVKGNVKQEYGVKFTLPKRDSCYSTENFIPYCLYNNIAKPTEVSNKRSNIEGVNNIDFRSGEFVELGEYNGEDIKLGWNEDTQRIESNLIVPAEYASKSGEYATDAELEYEKKIRKVDAFMIEIGDIVWAFNEFRKVAAGEADVSSIFDKQQEDLILGLEKMGVDLSKPFSIDGEEFYLRNDTGKIDYYNKKKYVMHNDGRIEIQDVGNENLSDTWTQLHVKYDVRNASFDEIREISRQLYNAGQITLFDHALLTFDPSESSQSIKPNTFLTQADSNGKRDWIAEYEARSARDQELGNLQGYTNQKEVIEILKKLL